NRVNKANQFTPRPVQLSNIRPNLSTASNTIKTGRVNVNTGHGNVNSGNVYVNSGTPIKSGSSRFNTGKLNVNSGSVHVNTARVTRPVSNHTSYKTSPKLSQVNITSPKKCFSKRSPVNRPFSRNTAQYAVKGKMGTAVKTSAGCVWRKAIPLSNTNGGPTPDSTVNVSRGPQGRPKPVKAWWMFWAYLEDYQELSKVGSVTFGGSKVKRIFKYIKGKPKLGLWYPRESPLDLVAYSDSDYAAANLDRKSTTGGCQFLGRRLISWQCKKQTIVATSTTEAEYVAAASCCGQVLWLQNQLLDYGFNFMNTIIHIDNQSTICIIKNPVYHSKTKHIEIRHHFIRDCYEKKLIQVQKIHTDLNVADLLTKAFDGPRLELPFLYSTTLQYYWRGKDVAGSTWEMKKAMPSCLLFKYFSPNLSMAQLKYCDKHNQVGFLLKPAESAGYTEIVDFLRRSKLRRQNPIKSASGINIVANEEIFCMITNISSKSGGWDQFGSNIATALICLSTRRDFNFSKLIFDGMISNLKSKSKFLMYPRFLQMILNVQTENKNLFVPVSLTKKIFGNMKRSFQGIHRPLLPAMLTIDAGQPQPSAAPTPSQPVPTPTPSHVQIPTPPITSTPPSTQPPPLTQTVQSTPTLIQPVHQVNNQHITPPNQPSQINTGEVNAAEVNTGNRKVPKKKRKEPMTEERTFSRKDCLEQEEEAAQEALATEFDYIQARLNADQILAEKLQQEEREQYSIEDRAKFLHDTIAAQRKFLAEQRSAAIRNKPPTISQLRNQMITYLKHVANKKHAELKSKSFEEIQVLYERYKKQDQTFVAIGTEEDERAIKTMNEKATHKEEEKKDESVHEEVKEEEGAKKRKLGTRRKLKAKRRKHASGLTREEDDLKICLNIAPDEDKVIDVESLDHQYPIVEWQSFFLTTKPQYDQSKPDEDISEVNHGKYKDSLPEALTGALGRLMIRLISDTADFWDTQQNWKHISWKLHSSSGVLSQMLELKLETEEESSMALELIKFVKQTNRSNLKNSNDIPCPTDHGEEEKGVNTPGSDENRLKLYELMYKIVKVADTRKERDERDRGRKERREEREGDKGKERGKEREGEIEGKKERRREREGKREERVRERGKEGVKEREGRRKGRREEGNERERRGRQKEREKESERYIKGERYRKKEREREREGVKEGEKERERRKEGWRERWSIRERERGEREREEEREGDRKRKKEREGDRKRKKERERKRGGGMGRERPWILDGKEVDIGLSGGRDKPLRLGDMLLYSWDGGLDICVDMTGSSSLTQTEMVDFVPSFKL
ncbi:hypothetical protein Tco_0573571, partial [Tanacetum coccineum]